MGVEYGVSKYCSSWKECCEIEVVMLGYDIQFYIVIIGGGQGGIVLGVWLWQLGVLIIIFDKYDWFGDQWCSCYKFLCLYDLIWYDYLFYIKFFDNWLVFMFKDKVGDWLEMYIKVMELNYWICLMVEKVSFDEVSGIWLVEVNCDGEKLILYLMQLVLVIGMLGKVNMLKFFGMDSFKGIIQYLFQYKGLDEWIGKKVVVIGLNNLVYDICVVLWEVEVDVIMVQWFLIYIVCLDSLMEIGLGVFYLEQVVVNGVMIEKVDMIFVLLFYKIMYEFQILFYDKMWECDVDFYVGLEKVGFKLDWGDDGLGLFMKYLCCGLGYYIDVGVSQLIIDGEIKLVQGQVDYFEVDVVVLKDGISLFVDLVVLVMGFGLMNGWVVDLISFEVVDKVGKVWGLGFDIIKDFGLWEGEQCNMWKFM